MRARQLLKLISGLTAALMLGVVLLIFVCPMTGAIPMTHSTVNDQTLCVDAGLINNVGAVSACVDMHLANALRFIRNLFSPVSVWLGLAVLALVLTTTISIFKNILDRVAFAVLVHLRQRFRLFYHSIRQQSQKTLLAYLVVLENSANVSLV